MGACVARRRTLGLALAWLVTSGPGWGSKPEQVAADAELVARRVEARVEALRAAASAESRGEMSPARRIAEAEILLRAEDHERAIHLLCQVDELARQGKVPGAAHADALFLLGEAYFVDQQLLSARRPYRELLERSDDAAYAPFAGRSLSRLVDVALRVGDLAAIDALAERLRSLPIADQDGSLKYARGKLAFARQDYAAAQQELAAVASTSPLAHQSRYLLGVVLMKEAVARAAEGASAGPSAPRGAASLARWAPAIEQFRTVAQLPARTAAHRHVVDLAWMAIGRLFYEAEAFLEAADAYSHVARRSPEFSTMLYELAWVYVRLDDHRRAQRALTVLAVTDPERLDLADGSLLRADLLLRAGEFAAAGESYRGVRQRFEPIREVLASFLASTPEPAAYYEHLLDPSGVTGGEGGGLPSVVVAWAREEAADANVFAMIDDVQRSRALLREARGLAAKLSAVLGSAARVKAFPEMRTALEAVLGPLNQLTLARRQLAIALDELGGRASAPALVTLRERRQALLDRAGRVPATEADFQRREATGSQQWNVLSQELQRLELQADTLQAVANGLRRVLTEPQDHGLGHDAPTRARFRAEIAASEREIAGVRSQIEEHRRAIELGKVQIGFGDQRYVDDERVRRELAALFAQEVAMVAAGGDGDRAQQFARAITPLLVRIARTEATLEAMRAELQAAADARSQDVSAQVVTEVANLEAQAERLDALDREARVLVGEVARQNFIAVGERLQSIVLRADIGIVQEAWEVRESRRVRLRELQRERANEDRRLDDELREVLDEAEPGP